MMSDDHGDKPIQKHDPQAVDIQDDYQYARAKYYNLAEKGDEAIDLMLELARESEHPRAFEVLSTMLKQNAEITDRLFALQKQNKELRLSDQKSAPEPGSLTQNNVYVGSTTELQRLLAQEEKDVTPPNTDKSEGSDE